MCVFNRLQSFLSQGKSPLFSRLTLVNQRIGCHDKTRLAYNSVLGNFTAKRDYITLLNLMRDGRIDPGDILSEIISPTQTSEIYNQLLTDRQFPLGVVFDWDQV